MNRFIGAALRVATAQLVRGVGYDRTSTAALDALTDVLGKYIEEVGARAHEYGEHAGRSEANALDALAALAAMRADPGGVAAFIDATDRIAFPKPLRPAHDAAAAQIAALAAAAAAVAPSRAWADRLQPPHVPAFLPPFPKRHTYAATPAPRAEASRAEVLGKRARTQRATEAAVVALAKESRQPFRDYAAAVGVVAASADAAGKKAPKAKRAREQVAVPLTTPIAASVEADHYHARTLSGEESSDGEQTQQQTLQQPVLSISPAADTEHARKRIKAEQILSLTHKDGMEETLYDAAGAGANVLSAAPGTEDAPPGVPPWQPEDDGDFDDSPMPPAPGLFQ